jgi:hypothetical protein
MPVVGDDVTVVFLAARVAGVIEHVHDSGRRLEVLTAEGEVIPFALDPATATFRTAGDKTAGRLVFEDPDSV